jgi:hypothetical protein
VRGSLQRKAGQRGSREHERLSTSATLKPLPLCFSPARLAHSRFPFPLRTARNRQPLSFSDARAYVSPTLCPFLL